ncbi:hypothetical protein HMPREF9629_00599 [Peptoanaerobacter stomatis]|uniref:Endolysin-like domain-containing protein n=1 Tax=Peptoanaerobacter stomatis TaxID=796937 RepID=G9X2J2_9FIRM|nr:NlpC/P60 family protein [Peptoanaerobacter stomatis]EHL11062.1 hypothetical protein HMPREF9629_00599 [Peptoanaerobacter stomatis]
MLPKIEKAVRFMIDIAQDNSHGYDQNQRWGERGDYDCSSLTITAFEKAGFPVKSNYGATYTGNMKQAFINCGFKDVRNVVNLYTGAGLIRGDILLNEVHHVAVYIGNGLIVQASINELGRATGGRPGDQTGYEINISKYKNYHRGGWDIVLRYEEKLDEKVIDKKGEIKKMSEKEKEYAVQAINKLAELKLLNSPDVHIKNIDKSNWALWVMIAKMNEKIDNK